MMAISTDSSAARRRRDEVDEDDTSGSTNMVESSYQELPSGSQYVNIQKGAFPIHGTNPSVVSDTYSVTPPPQSHEAFAVAARVVDRYEENCEEVLRRQEERINQQERELEHFRRTQELQERLRQREEFVENQQKELEELRQARQGGIVFGEIISRDNDGDEQVDVDTARDNNKRPPASDNMQASSLNRPSSSKRSIVIGLVIILACVGIAVGLVFALRPKSTTEPTEILTTEPTAISSTAPPAAPTSPSSTTADLLSSVSFDEGAALGTPGTPQSMAYNWLVENINIDTYSDKTKIQRYVLATLFYSTNGDSWTANSGWLGNENECGWSGILCTYDSIMELMLSDSNLVGTIPGEIGLLSDSLGKCLYLRLLSITLVLVEPQPHTKPSMTKKQKCLGLI
jgi:TolA-binding protein